LIFNSAKREVRVPGACCCFGWWRYVLAVNTFCCDARACDMCASFFATAQGLCVEFERLRKDGGGKCEDERGFFGFGCAAK
jgi:hypothetical protein